MLARSTFALVKISLTTLGAALICNLLLQTETGARETKSAAKPRQVIFSLSQDQQNSEILKIWAVPACVLMGKEKPRGVYVTGFTGNGLGNQLGLQVGDVLLSLNGHVIMDAHQADSLLARTKSGTLKAVIARQANIPGGVSLLNPSVNYVCDSLNQSYASQNGKGVAVVSAPKEQPTELTIAALEDYMIGLVNQDRAQNGGLPPLRKSSQLGALARHYAEDMKKRGFFSHDDPDGLTPVGRARKAGITASIWENLATESGSQSLKTLVQRGEQQMMDEPRDNPINHRGCILNARHQCIGIGVAVLPNKVICVQEFSPNEVP